MATISTVVASVGLAVIAAPTAAADPSPIAPTTSDVVTADALPTVQIDGVAWSQAIANNTVYVGGSFTNARPAGSAAGQNTTPRSNFLAYNLSNGQLVTGFDPVVNGQVQAVAVSPNGQRVYIAGDFTQVDGVTANRVAALDATTGELISTFKINIGSRVKAIVATDTTVYVGGLFTAANGQLRDRLAAYNASNGGLTAWNPGADSNVNALALTPDGKVIVGGNFLNLGGGAAYGLGAVDATTGALLPWAANQVVRNAGDNSAILSLSTDGTSIFGTGYAFGQGGNLEGTFSADPATGAINWVEDCHGDTYAAYSTGKVVYTVSHAHYCGNIGGFYQSDPWGTNMRHALAFTPQATGTIGHDPLGYFDWFGKPSPSMINWFPNFAIGSFTGQDQAAWHVTGNGQYVVMGGEFPSVNGVAQQGLVRFQLKPGAPSKRGPMVTGNRFMPNLLQTSPTTVRVGFPANWDQDDMNLTYRVVRNSNTAAPRYTTTADSTFWNRPMLGFEDQLPATDPPGTTYRYRLYVVDSAGNQVAGDTATITTSADVTPSSYETTVKEQGASLYWRLGEPSGTAAIDSSGGYNDGLVSAGVTRGEPGAILNDPNSASTLNGTTTGLVVTQTPAPAPDTFTAEAWFKTTTTQGGRILGFSNLPVGNSNWSDRLVYMDNSGRILYGVNNGANRTLNTTKSYNDGQWHQVVVTLSPEGMVLYLDGLRVAKRTDTTTGRAISGFWRIGGDTLSGWTSRPTSAYFAGSIDEVSVYPTALNRDQVVAQFIASGRPSPIPPAPADAYGSAVYTDQPDLFWRLGESSGTVANDSSASVNPGTYSGGLTFGQAGAINGLANTSVLFNGSSGIAASVASFTNPVTYSVEAWFKTTTTRGGRIIGFGSSATGLSSSYDRHIYMQNSGRLAFGAYNGAQVTVVSPNSYNNNEWHHVVGTQGGDGMKLYVDGQLVGTNPNTVAQNYTGYWRIGGDRTWGSLSTHFAGTIDEAAVYPTVLTGTRVVDHYKASGRTLPNQAPVAAFTSSAAGLNVAFDGSSSTDSDGTLSTYSWNFGGGATATGATASYRFAQAGTYNVSLTVTDDSGATNTMSRQVTVTNAPPAAAFTASVQDLTVSLDASGSTDADGTISSYAWKFGDGATATGVTANHTYASPGPYTVELTVTDNAGGTNTITKSVTAVGPNVVPVATFTSSPTDLSVLFDAAESSDADGTITGYAWEFGDGTTGTGATVTHQYQAGGSFQVKLTVTDNRGGTGTFTQTVSVTAPNVPPTAEFDANAVNLTVSVDAGASSDTDGTIQSYAWNFGDGSTATGVTASHTYASAGTRTISLTVTDNRGGTDTRTQTITVMAANVSPDATFTATATNLSVAFNGTGSADPDGTIQSYAWTFGDNTTGTGASPSHTYPAAGVYSVTLVVTDNRGGTGTFTDTVTVTAPAGPQPIANDAFGRNVANGWGTADLGGSWTTQGSASLFNVTGGGGTIRMASAGAGPLVYLNSVSAKDLSGSVDVSLDTVPTGGGVQTSVLTRRIGTSDYRVKLRLQPTSTIIQISKVVNGVEAPALRSTTIPLVYQAGDVVRFAFEVRTTQAGDATGISAKAWKVGTTEPAAFQSTATDNQTGLQAAGSLGLQAYLTGTGTAPVVAKFDNLTFSTL